MLAACGTDQAPAAGEDGRVAVTPRALAAIVSEHVDPGEARRTTGDWSDWSDPPAVEAQVDYGVDPEGTEDGESRTVRVTVSDIAAYDGEDRRWFACQPEDEGRCEQSEVDGRSVLFRWRPGAEEEEGGGYYWLVLGDDEVVRVAYDESDLFPGDPRTLDLAVQPDDLRAAALDSAMSLRTTTDAWEAGEQLDNYEGVEHPPEEPEVVPTTPRQLASRVVDYLGIEPTSVRRSSRTELGPDTVGARLTFDGTAKHDPFTIDVLTTAGRAEQIDPLPCPVQRSGEAARRACFAWDDDTAATWTLAAGGRPGVLWIIGAQDDDTFNRVETVAVRIESAGLVEPYFTRYEVNPRVPQDILTLAPMTSDLSLGPETRLPD